MSKESYDPTHLRFYKHRPDVDKESYGGTLLRVYKHRSDVEQGKLRRDPPSRLHE